MHNEEAYKCTADYYIVPFSLAEHHTIVNLIITKVNTLPLL